MLYGSSDSGEEGVLNTLWQKYENAIDKVLTVTEFSPDIVSQKTLCDADHSLKLEALIWVRAT